MNGGQDDTNDSLESDELSTREVIDAELVPIETGSSAVMPAMPDGALVPALVADGGAGAHYAYEEFFYGELAGNKHTERAYRRAVHRFLEECQELGLTLHEVRPAHVSRHINEYPAGDATKKVHLAAIRKFFDKLEERHAVILNPARSVKGPKIRVVEGLTPEIPQKTERELLDSIDTSDIVGLRDYCVIATMIGTAARRGAISRLDVNDLRDDGTQWSFRFIEKGGKRRTIPVRHDLVPFLLRYIEEAEIDTASPPLKPEGGGKAPRWPLFRAAIRRTKALSENPFKADDMGRMLKRRLKAAGLPMDFTPHSFRVATLTDLCSQEGVAREDVQYLAGHADARTTALYDRSKREVSRNLVERISTKLDG